MTIEKFLTECEARLPELHYAENFLTSDIERLIKIVRVMQKAIEEISPVFEIGREEFDKLRLVSTLPHELDTCSIVVREMKARAEVILREVV